MKSPARICSLVVAALTIALPTGVQADNVAALQLPQPGAFRGKIPPWQIQVDGSGVEGGAYRGVKITVAAPPGSPYPEAHTLRVVLCPNGHSRFNYDEKVTAYIDVPANAPSVEAIVNVPQRQQWNVMHVEFFEDGVPLKHYDAAYNQMRTGGRYWGDDFASVIVIDADAPTRDQYRNIMTTITSSTSPVKNQHNLPDVRWLLAAIPGNQVNGNNVLSYTTEKYDDAQLLQTFATHGGIDVLPPSELSSSWLSLSNADLIVVSLDDLQLLKEKHAEQHEALQHWIMAGGSLVVYNVGDQWQELSKLCTLVGVEDERNGPGEESPWKLANRSKFKVQVDGVNNQNNGYSYAIPGGGGMSSTTVVVDPSGMAVPVNTWTKPPFAWRHCGLGAVVAYRSDPFPGLPVEWNGLWNTLESRQFLWSRRHGMSHRQDNPDFWNFVIPGVGEAPVFSFMTMIALFMLAIGPANYYYLNRWRRLSLLLVTVPVGAGIFTGGLFAFALLSDGFSTRARVRSFTVIEPKSSQAATMSRQTYYTAFVPSDGMRYPTNTAVYPLHYSPQKEAISNYFFYQSDSQWVDDKLQLQRRYLTAREHRQFVTVRSTDTPARLEARATGSTMQVENRLGVPIDFLMLVDDQGKLFGLEDMAVDAQAIVPPLDPAVAQRQWHARIDPKTPTMPPNYDPNRYDTIFSRNRFNYSFYGRNQSQWGPTQSTGVLERGISEVDSMLGRIRDGGGSENKRTFVAITAESIKGGDGEPMAPLGVRGSRLVESLHVVKGSW
jgi:hypothetical protein